MFSLDFRRQRKRDELEICSTTTTTLPRTGTGNAGPEDRKWDAFDGRQPAVASVASGQRRVSPSPTLEIGTHPIRSRAASGSLKSEFEFFFFSFGTDQLLELIEKE